MKTYVLAIEGLPFLETGLTPQVITVGEKRFVWFNGMALSKKEQVDLEYRAIIFGKRRTSGTHYIESLCRPKPTNTQAFEKLTYEGSLFKVPLMKTKSLDNIGEAVKEFGYERPLVIKSSNQTRTINGYKLEHPEAFSSRTFLELVNAVEDARGKSDALSGYFINQVTLALGMIGVKPLSINTFDIFNHCEGVGPIDWVVMPFIGGTEYRLIRIGSQSFVYKTCEDPSLPVHYQTRTLKQLSDYFTEKQVDAIESVFRNKETPFIVAIDVIVDADGYINYLEHSPNFMVAGYSDIDVDRIRDTILLEFAKVIDGELLLDPPVKVMGTDDVVSITDPDEFLLSE